jgi:3-oxoacyl-(acyl-carrier-protein) synthase/predicted phosphodiesterase
VLNGPRPAEAVARVRELEADGALVVQGNTDIAVADFDFAAAFPWMEEVPESHRAAAEWASEQLSDEDLDYLRRLPAERRLWHADEMVLVCHASPGSQTSGLPADLDPGVVVERVTRTDARVIACGHTHVADVRELGRKLIVNPGSCGYAFDGEASACWALISLPDSADDANDGQPTAELFRTDLRCAGGGRGGVRARPAGRRLPGGNDPHGPAGAVSQPRRVVVTGMGTVTPLGNDVATFWSALIAGESGVRRIASFDASRVASKIAGEVRDFDPSGVLDRKELRRNDRYTQFILVATAEAMRSAGLAERLEGEIAEQTGIIIGSGLGGSGTLVEQIGINVTRGPDRLSPFFIPMAIANMGTGQAAITFGAQGPNWATVSACATAGHAIGEAAETIIRGDAEMMFAGGSEASVYEAIVGAFAAMRALSTRNDDPAGASRPFDEGRDGFVMAEGAGVLVLEELGHAQRRGAPIVAELLGYGATADASHITLPAPGGMGGVRAARRAMAKAANCTRRGGPHQRPRDGHARG